jgi:iron only hydrogenase large subunit-like protein
MNCHSPSFIGHKIDLTALPPEEFPAEASSLGRGFAIAGGVAGAIEEAARIRHGLSGLSIAKADSLRSCRRMLQEIVDRKISPQLVGGMACPGGCVGGPGTLIGLNQAKIEVSRFAAMAKKYPSCPDD